MYGVAFCGAAFTGDQKDGAWGYEQAKNGEELLSQIGELLDGIAQTEFQGYCYTQLTDVEQEVNGLLYADRTPKIPCEQLARRQNEKPEL